MTASDAKAATPKLEAARRIVIKIGSALLVDEASRSVRRSWLEALSDDLAALKAAGSEIVVVSSQPDGALELGGPTVTVLENSDDRFAPSRRVWNQHTYHHSNIAEDGRVPTHEPPHWAESNDFRSNRGLDEQALCIPPVLSDGT